MYKYILLTILTILVLIAILFLFSLIGKDATILLLLAYLLLRDIKQEVEK